MRPALLTVATKVSDDSKTKTFTHISERCYIVSVGFIIISFLSPTRFVLLIHRFTAKNGIIMYSVA